MNKHVIGNKSSLHKFLLAMHKYASPCIVLSFVDCDTAMYEEAMEAIPGSVTHLTILLDKNMAEAQTLYSIPKTVTHLMISNPCIFDLPETLQHVFLIERERALSCYLDIPPNTIVYATNAIEYYDSDGGYKTSQVYSNCYTPVFSKSVAFASDSVIYISCEEDIERIIDDNVMRFLLENSRDRRTSLVKKVVDKIYAILYEASNSGTLDITSVYTIDVAKLEGIDVVSQLREFIKTEWLKLEVDNNILRVSVDSWIMIE